MAQFPIQIAKEVEEALRNGKAVIALESAIITHGMPHPTNVEVATRCMAIAREHHVIPATIGILDGTIIVGMNHQEIAALAQKSHPLKVGRRELTIATTTGASGGTTISATISVAALTGIKIMVTGGIGGVHYGAEHTFDISADLPQIATHNIAVVCAGPKAILDSALTCQYLETHSIPIIGYCCDWLPLFYTRRSPHAVTARMDHIADIANYLIAKWEMALQGGVIVANPCPPQQALESQELERLLQSALAEAQEQNIQSQQVTPWLLARMAELSHNRTLEANCALVYHNAAVGAQLARAYSPTNNPDQ